MTLIELKSGEAGCRQWAEEAGFTMDEMANLAGNLISSKIYWPIGDAIESDFDQNLKAQVYPMRAEVVTCVHNRFFTDEVTAFRMNDEVFMASDDMDQLC